MSLPPPIQAEEVLREHGLYALPVVGRDEEQADRLLGLITRAEISKAFRVREPFYCLIVDVLSQYPLLQIIGNSKGPALIYTN